MEEYFTTPDYNKFTNTILDAEIKEKQSVNESDMANFVKKTDFDDKLENTNKKITSNKLKHVEWKKKKKKKIKWAVRKG